MRHDTPFGQGLPVCLPAVCQHAHGTPYTDQHDREPCTDGQRRGREAERNTQERAYLPTGHVSGLREGQTGNRQRHRVPQHLEAAHEHRHEETHGCLPWRRTRKESLEERQVKLDQLEEKCYLWPVDGEPGSIMFHLGGWK